jgi:hypothetical protein
MVRIKYFTIFKPHHSFVYTLYIKYVLYLEHLLVVMKKVVENSFRFWSMVFKVAERNIILRMEEKDGEGFLLQS